MNTKRFDGLAGCTRRLPHLGDERGIVLLMTMVILLIVSGLAAAGLLNSYIERSIAKNEHYGSISLAAADTGLGHGLTWLNATPPTAGDYANPAGYTPADITNSLANEGDYTVRVRFKLDVEDWDGDGSTADYVLFNSCARGTAGCFGYPDSLYDVAGGGYPVVEITSTGAYHSAGTRVIRLDVGRNKFDITVEGAMTARSNVGVSGSANIDGDNHDETGSPGGSCGSDMPGIFVDVGKSVTESGGGHTIDGTPATLVNDGSTTIENSPWGIMGISKSDFEGVFNKVVPTGSGTVQIDLPATGNTWITGVNTGGVAINTLKVNGTGTSEGILVVHNENYDPDVWDVSNPALATYNPGDANYRAAADTGDPSYDPTYAPAVFTMNGNYTFKGVIIADSVLKVNGNPAVIGAIVSVGNGGVETDVTGNIDILYSCDAIESAVQQGYSTKLAWHRVY